MKFSAGLVLLAIAGLMGVPTAQAQVTVDGSLSTTVYSSGATVLILNGDRQGANLFHSFREFSVPVGGTAVFDLGNQPIVNIFSRITGRDLSRIEGAIATINHSAPVNLFLLNPNGIIFGSNAQLLVNGSVITSTASAIKFQDGTQFATDQPALLTLSVPIGLQFGANPGAIAIVGDSPSNPPLGVPLGQRLTFAGGAVQVNGRLIAAPAGQIEVAGIGASELIGLTPNLSLAVPNAGLRSDVSFSNGAQVYVGAPVGGSITVYGRDIEIAQGSALTAGVFGVGAPTLRSGNLSLNATGDIRLTDSFLRNIVTAGAVGNAGDIEIQGRSLISDRTRIQTVTLGQGNGGNVHIEVQDKAAFSGDNFEIQDTYGISSVITPTGIGRAGHISVSAATVALTDSTGFSSGTLGQGQGGDITITTQSYVAQRGGILASTVVGQGDAGNITIHAQDVLISGTSSIGLPSLISSAVDLGGQGNAGAITITTGTMQLSDGAFITSSTRSQGNGGDIHITASERVLVSTAPETPRPSSIASDVNEIAIGKGGNVSITTPELQLVNSSAITTRTLGQGDGGNITIKSDRITAEAGAQLFTTSNGSGQAGNISLTVTDTLSLSGHLDPDYFAWLASGTAKGFFGEDLLAAGSGSGIYVNTTSTATGGSGDLSLVTRNLSLNDGARIDASSLGKGNAGSLTITAERLRLSQSLIQSESVAGDRGSIEIDTRYLISDRGTISASAREASNGGSLRIRAEALIGLNNSDIIARAEFGRGGNIQLNAQTILGYQARPVLTPGNDISASSTAAIDGTVELNTVNADGLQSLSKLPTALMEASQQIAQGCSDRSGSRFVITGRGGIPISPLNDQVLAKGVTSVSSGRTWSDLRDMTVSAPAVDVAAPMLVEATQWRKTTTGRIELVAGTSSHPLRQPLAGCSSQLN